MPIFCEQKTYPIQKICDNIAACQIHNHHILDILEDRKEFSQKGQGRTNHPGAEGAQVVPEPGHSIEDTIAEPGQRIEDAVAEPDHRVTDASTETRQSIEDAVA